MRTAKEILELAKKHFPKTDESLNDVGDVGKGSMMVIKGLVSESHYSSNKSQLAMVSEMKKLAESEEEISNEFMKHMDESASKFVAKKVAEASKEKDMEDEEDDDKDMEDEESAKKKKKDGDEDEDEDEKDGEKFKKKENKK